MNDPKPMIDIKFVILNMTAGSRICPLQFSHELSQLGSCLSNSPGWIKLRWPLSTKTTFYLDMSSVMLMLLPFNIPDFRRTSSLSLYSSNVTEIAMLSSLCPNLKCKVSNPKFWTKGWHYNLRPPTTQNFSKQIKWKFQAQIKSCKGSILSEFHSFS